jgi:hypothetical protein
MVSGLVRAAGPLFFSAAYALGSRYGRPGMGWSLSAVAAHLAAQLLAHGPLASGINAGE